MAHNSLTPQDRVNLSEVLSQNPPNSNSDREASPTEDRFLQPIPTPSPLPTETPVLPTPTPEPSTPPAADTNIQVQKVEIKGSSIFTEADFKPITQKVEGQTVSLDQLTEVANQITQLYLNRGFLTSRALIAPQAIANGVVQINIIEGSLEKIQIDGTNRLNPGYIRSRINLVAGTPLNIGKLEEQLRLLRSDPLFTNVEASLRAGSAVGKSILIVRVSEAKNLDINLSFDNYSPPSVGSERLGTSLTFRNLSGIGDELYGSYRWTTTGGADVFDFSYRVPVNAMNGTLQLRAAPNSNRITQEPFNALGINGNSQLYEISYRQPLVRTLREEFALSLGLTHQQGQTFTFAGPTPFSIGPDADGVSRTTVIKFGQDYVKRDPKGAWAVRSLFNIGTGWFDATNNADPIPDGHFFSWLGQIQRVQVLNEDNFLIAQAEIQFTPDSLLPSEQFVIGGGQSVRGYRQNARAGDNGFRFSLEDRITLARDEAGVSTLILAPFVDLGYVWNQSDNPNILQDQKFLAGLGLGVMWEPIPNLNLRLDYGLPLVNLSDRGDNIQDDGLYFSLNYRLRL
ncbi:ShlB/FhaC/HecB family hemolysin secretion/activation protein [Merismopedia glauca]|uniref:ShlB/FhaC/HecB family hemolysin secretion/activation protein n=1 Tax=Merismopedia glauca TaxID=292586 RepID=UPI001FE56624|nr:ShlB/FhaC/HecB family hemolysin secretion/activation protein [Merismopedia glauca]